jgi:phosphoserine aminotransferase
LSEAIGGIQGLKERNRRKAEKLYEAIERAEEKGTLRCIVKDKHARSWMNVVLRWWRAVRSVLRSVV